VSACSAQGVIRTAILEGCRYSRLPEAISADRQRQFLELLRSMEPAAFADRAPRAVTANKAIIIRTRVFAHF
jgi:hypothetical protein